MPPSDTLKQTIAYAGVPVDARGLLPLDEARKILEATTTYPGAPVHKGRTPEEKRAVTESHRIHAALVSLDTAAEALGHLTRLTWGSPLYDATTLVERYGDAVLPWLAGAVKDGELSAKAWEFEPALARIGTELAFELLLKLRIIGFDDALRQHPVGSVAELPELDPKARIDVRVENAITLFIKTNPRVAARVIGRRVIAAPKNKRLRELVKRLPKDAVAAEIGDALPVEPLTTKAILELLDEAASDPSPEAWPKFATGIEDDPATLEYFALRLIGVRAKKGEGWGIVLERITGSYSRHEPTRICRFLYGSFGTEMTEHTLDFGLDRVPNQAEGETLDSKLDGVVVRGPAGEASLSDALTKELDLKPGLGSEYEGDPGFNLRLRAYLALHPDAFWGDANEVSKALQIVDGEVLVDTHAFRHVVGSTYKRVKKTDSWYGPPSKSNTYKSLADALVKRKVNLFAAGDSNVDARLHAINKTQT